MCPPSEFLKFRNQKRLIVGDLYAENHKLENSLLKEIKVVVCAPSGGSLVSPDNLQMLFSLGRLM